MTTTSLTQATAPTGGRRSRRARRDWRGWAFVAPFMIVFAAMIIAPVVYAIYLSLFRQQLIGGNAFVGLGNYLAVLQDGKFWDSLGRVVLFLLVQVPVMLVLSLVAALALDSARLHGAGFFRIALFLPYAVPGVVAALIWGFIYGDQFGLTASLNQLLGTNLAPLSGQWVLASIGNIVTWEFVGYNMLIFYAALRVIPNELYEAAEIDGAGAFRTVFSIKLPAIRGAIVIATIFSIIGSFQLFSEPKLLYEIAPNAIGTSFSPNLYAYNLAFTNQDMNYSAAIAFLLGFMIMIVSYVVQLSTARREKKGARR